MEWVIAYSLSLCVHRVSREIEVSRPLYCDSLSMVCAKGNGKLLEPMCPDVKFKFGCGESLAHEGGSSLGWEDCPCVEDHRVQRLVVAKLSFLAVSFPGHICFVLSVKFAEVVWEVSEWQMLMRCNSCSWMNGSAQPKVWNCHCSPALKSYYTSQLAGVNNWAAVSDPDVANR